jgi:hypothetical protein
MAALPRAAPVVQPGSDPMSNRIVNLAGLGAFAALALSIDPAQAGSVRTFSCFGTWGSVSCVATRGAAGDPNVIQAPEPASDEERSAADLRDKRWFARCRPLVQQDKYGVPRYVYAAEGCEYGRLD